MNNQSSETVDTTGLRSVFLFRHGETEWNTEGRYQGLKDSPLTARGRQQAVDHANLMKQFAIDCVYASPLGRVRETLTHMQRIVPLAITFENCLVELGAGKWEGRRYDEVKELYGAQLQNRKSNLARFKPPGGESRSELLSRLLPIRRRILEPDNNCNNPYAILSHGAVTRILLMSLLGISIDEDPPFSTDNYVVYRIDVLGDKVEVYHFVNGAHSGAGLYFPSSKH